MSAITWLSYCDQTQARLQKSGLAIRRVSASTGSTAGTGPRAAGSGVGIHGRSYSGAVPESAFSGRSALVSPPWRTMNRSSAMVSPTMAKSRSHLSNTARATASFSGRSTISIRSWLSESIIS